MNIDEILEINDTGEFENDGDKVMEVVVEVDSQKELLKMSLSTMLDLWQRLGNVLGKGGFGFSKNPDDETVGECFDRRKEEVKAEYESYDDEE